MPVKGTVFVNDEPAAGVYLQFYPDGPTPANISAFDSTRTESDGSFTVSIRGPGNYTLAAIWPTVTDNGDEQVEGEDRFRGQFRSAEHSGMKITLKKGATEFPPIRFSHP